MEPKLAPNYRYFTRVTPHDTKTVHPHAIPYGSYDEDTVALVLAWTCLVLMAVATVSMLFVFHVI